MVVAAQANLGERVAIAAGVAFAFANQRFNLLRLALGPGSDLGSWWLPFYIVIGLAVAAALVAFTQRASSDGPLRGSAFVPVLVVVAVSGAVQLGHFARQQRIADEQTSGYWALAMAVAAGAILLWLGYRWGKIEAARWVALGFALGAPGLVMAFGFYYFGPIVQGQFLVSAAVATIAGVTLALLADRFFPWDALGVAVTAAGMVFGSVSYPDGLPFASLANALITGGFGFALAVGLTRVVRTLGAAGQATGQVAMSLLLDLVALFVTADAISPATWTMVDPNGFIGPTLNTPVTVLVSASVLLLLFGFLRSADRSRRSGEISAQSLP